MKAFNSFIYIILFHVTCYSQNSSSVPLQLHPDNTNYFRYKEKPTVLITSGEHYGAVLNAEFNFEKYLNELQKNGFNYTRIFIGPYSEIGFNNFGISFNTMNPKPEFYLTPWKFDKQTKKYDLNQWNSAFFKRLSSFIEAAENQNIIVEITLFTSYYTDVNWQNSPFHSKNNINNTDSLILFNNVNTLENNNIYAFQEKYVRKIVNETNHFNNIFFEVQNEPYADQPVVAFSINENDNSIFTESWQKRVEIASTSSLKWQTKIASIITSEEKLLPKKHLIAQNISNFQFELNTSNSDISIFNFHYANPQAVIQNAHLLKVMALDETGFMPHNNYTYRSQAWKFILAGGAVYNNLDYSFAVGSEDGSHKIDKNTPGHSSKEYRAQLSVLKQFIEGFDFLKMKSRNTIIMELANKQEDVFILAETGKQYAIYICNGLASKLKLEIPNGTYLVEWINTKNGNVEQSEKVESINNIVNLNSPSYTQDIAARILHR